MPSPRKNHLSLDATPYYHCVGRCVRRAFLWGKDQLTGQDFSHRKLWVTERLSELSKVFAVNICAYAVMSNHYHLVLHIDAQRARSWSDAEVGQRWGLLYCLPVLAQRYLKGEFLDTAEIRVAQEILAQLRHRLSDLSWYMRSLNEPIARRANEEDACTGRFWEGRFKSQPILDEAGLLACCVYVDLNPLRANMAATPETSDFTAIQQRLREFAKQVAPTEQETPKVSLATLPTSDHVMTPKLCQASIPETAQSEFGLPTLHPFANHLNADPAHGLPYALVDYIELVDWTARIVRPDKNGSMPSNTPAILTRLGFSSAEFQKHMQAQAMHRGTVIGQVERLKAYAVSMNKRCVIGIRMPAMCQGI